jgi:hypothetical protein
MKLLFAAAVASLAVGTSSVMAQPPDSPRSNIILLAQGRNMEKDLGVSDEVSRNLTVLREEYQATTAQEYQNAGLNPRQVPSMTPEQRDIFVKIGKRLNDEYLPKAASLLSPDQITRLRQIEFQNDLRTRGIGAILHNEVASELGLTGNQRRDMNLLSSEYRQDKSAGVEKAVEIMTDGQKEILDRLKGREFVGRR